ncbi:cytochrome c peroxidase [Flavobacterium sp. YJ01]|uniref:cytochrome-c peroxidase n=1 Tax=unclassified Flavobacterium TaxID=196869 RepID=UPI0023E3C2CC|nr:cytochrome c peroxidase [Flavobacterium sp. YJ01]WET03005.1 cytochrome c peroxidase [Flavobacterium sp. YJ01]
MESHYKKIILLFVLVAAGIFMAAIDIEPLYVDPYKLEYPDYFGNRISIPEDNPTTKQGVYLGRMLFYETKLSSSKTISCASCHQQKLAFTDGKAFSSGIDNRPTKRSSMSLANLLWVRNFFWDGRAKGLEEQAKFPLNDPHEMGNYVEKAVKELQKTKEYPILFKEAFGSAEITSDKITKAIAQFERTLISADSRYDKYLRNQYKPSEQELKGMELFMNSPIPEKNIRGANCAQCHGTPKMYMELFHNNGLDEEPKDIGREEFTGAANDKGRFRVATLRNIGLTAPYMHDGRFKTLEEVLDHYNEHIIASKTLSVSLRNSSNDLNGKKLGLTTDEKSNIISFLKMLTDSTFISNPKFSDPHLKNSINN